MECWNNGILGFLFCLINIVIHGKMYLMLRPTPNIRYHIATILAAHWIQFVAQYKRWIRPVVFENVRKVLSCRTPVLGCHLYQCKGCGHIELVPHSCKSRFCPTCGKHATDVWAKQVLNRLLDVPYHHLIMAIPWSRLGSGTYRHHNES